MCDSHCVNLCTMYNFHDVYLRALWTIYMYKFNRYHVIIFHSFFLSNDRFSTKFDPFIPKFIRKSHGQFSEKVGNFR
jgi:hypothetical protein